MTDNTTLRYTGVSFRPGRNGRKDRWTARIRVGGTREWLGSFPSCETALEAYCKAAGLRPGMLKPVRRHDARNRTD